MKLSELIEGLEYELICGNLDVEVESITNDSRKATEGGLFFAIKGAVVDGAKFIPEVIRNGVSVIITEKTEKQLAILFENDILENGLFSEDENERVTIVEVKRPRYAMGIISSRFYGDPSEDLTVIGITGTKGKTTTAYMIREMLELAGIRTGLVGTIEIYDGEEHIPALNTTPESIVLHKKLRDMVDNGLEAVVMEVSSQGLMLDRVAGCDFDYGIFTNLSPDHIGPNEHSSFEEYRDEKKKLFSLCKCGIYNIDDPSAKYMMEGSTSEPITFGRDEFADYMAVGKELYRDGGVLGVKYNLEGTLEGEVRVDLPGEFSIHNSMAAIVVADCMGVSFDEIRRILGTIKVRGRVEMIPISDSFTLMIDYAHNGMSLESLLNSIREYNPKRLVTLFGCGGNRDICRRYEMGEVSGRLSDFSIITSDNPRKEDPEAIIEDIKIGMAKTDGEYISIVDRKEAIRYAIMNAQEGDIIILAGKGHEDYQEINGVKHHMDERELIRDILEEEDVSKICGYNNRYFA